MLGLLEQSKVVNVGGRIAFLGSFVIKTLQFFDGGPDPMAAENWLLKMEKLLSALECTDAQKVLYATYAL